MHDSNPTTRRFPRTMAEAFPDEANRPIEHVTPNAARDWIACWTERVVVALVITYALARLAGHFAG